MLVDYNTYIYESRSTLFSFNWKRCGLHVTIIVLWCCIEQHAAEQAAGVAPFDILIISCECMAWAWLFHMHLWYGSITHEKSGEWWRRRWMTTWRRMMWIWKSWLDIKIVSIWHFWHCEYEDWLGFDCPCDHWLSAITQCPAHLCLFLWIHWLGDAWSSGNGQAEPWSHVSLLNPRWSTDAIAGTNLDAHLTLCAAMVFECLPSNNFHSSSSSSNDFMMPSLFDAVVV